MNPALIRLRTEIRHFYLISLLNLVFAALVMAFGIYYLMTAVLGQAADPATAMLRILTGGLAMAGFGLGISWLRSTVRIFEGVEEISDELDAAGDAITDNRVTCLIVQMLSHYRENRYTVRTMILVCTLGGCCFFILGITNSLDFLSVVPGGIRVTLDNLLLIPAMLLTLGIALASLLSSYYFSRFASVWDRRLHEIGRAECDLKRTLEMDEA